MLNISNSSIREKLDMKRLDSYKETSLPKANRMLSIWLILTLIITLIIFFLPWTQNIKMKGKVTTLLPEHRPQNVNSTIAGKIKSWYVREGDFVSAGDTLAHLMEVKVAYMDDQLVARTAQQMEAKSNAIGNYKNKANSLDNQINAMERELILKQEQLENKLEQIDFKRQSMEAAIQQAEVDQQIARLQLNRTDTLFQKGIKSLSDLEAKKLKVQQVEAKLINIQNKQSENNNERNIVDLQIQNLKIELQNKVAKTRASKYSTLSEYNAAQGELNKLENTYANYKKRNEMYHIIAPQSGYVT